MHLADGVLYPEQFPAFSDLVRQCLRDLTDDRRAPRASLDRRVHPATQLSEADALGQCIDGHDPPGVHGLGGSRLHRDVTCELKRRAERFHLAGDAHQLTLTESLADEPPAEPRGAHSCGCAIGGIEQLDLRHLLPRPCATLIERAEDRFHRLQLSRAQLTDRDQLRVIEIRTRKVPQEVADRLDAKALEQLLVLLAHPRERRDPQVER